MTQVYQTIIDPGHGNCMQAVFASLFDKKIEEVPHFLELQNQSHEDPQQRHSGWYYVDIFLKTIGYEITDYIYPSAILNVNNPYSIQFLLSYIPSVNGFYYATVKSPKYWESHKSTHAVVLNHAGETACDPNPEYQNRNYRISDIDMIAVIEPIKNKKINY